ncbi:MAG: NUDIX hydrolase [bacterium]
MQELRGISGQLNQKQKKLSVGVAAVIIEARQILLVRNTSTNIWSFPGGHVAVSESLPEALQREVREETNLQVNVLDEPIFYQYEIIPGLTLLLFFFKTKISSKKIVLKSINDEISEIRWFPLDQLPEKVYENTAYVIQHFIKW